LPDRGFVGDSASNVHTQRCSDIRKATPGIDVSASVLLVTTMVTTGRMPCKLASCEQPAKPCTAVQIRSSPSLVVGPNNFDYRRLLGSAEHSALHHGASGCVIRTPNVAARVTARRGVRLDLATFGFGDRLSSGLADGLRLRPAPVPAPKLLQGATARAQPLTPLRPPDRAPGVDGRTVGADDAAPVTG
jgi:hypothetical protein